MPCFPSFNGGFHYFIEKMENQVLSISQTILAFTLITHQRVQVLLEENTARLDNILNTSNINKLRICLGSGAKTIGSIL
jgi:hypothetical protein